MRKLVFFCKHIAIAAIVTLGGCSRIDAPATGEELVFTVVDVGQGLAQISVMGGRAALWDMGPPGSAGSWDSAYTSAGRPWIDAIIFSHGDLDHTGGLRTLPVNAGFSGLVITRPGEDTAAIRAIAGPHAPSLRFRAIATGDTLSLFPTVTFECLWPPSNGALSDESPNRSSLCVRVVHGYTSFILTGDIDTSVEKVLCANFAKHLRSDIFVVPHHGSGASLDPVFFGFCAPAYAIVSCGRNNTYGHPADAVVKLLTIQMGATLLDTRFQGTISLKSNGYYWSE
jgi:competence protein ComEC